MSIGFIGAGRMAQALAKGFISAGIVKGKDIVASCAPDDTTSAGSFKELGANVIYDNAEIVSKSDIAIIAVKPHVVSTVLNDIKTTISPNVLLISLAMGVTLSTIEKALPGQSRVIRVMPNTPALVRKGATVYAPGSSILSGDCSTTEKLFKAVGTCHKVPEPAFDAVTALSGSGPAYVYTVVEAMADGGVRMGLPRELALALSAQTVIGAGAMVAETGAHPAQLRDNVSSPSGSTCEGMACIEEGAVRHAFIKAVTQATLRCRLISSE